MVKTISLDGKKIGGDSPVYIIAEAGINHNGDVKLAREMISAAKKSGADSIKFQTYITEKRVPKGSPIFGILKQCELSFDAQADLAKFSKDQGIVFFSTPFDEESADFLASIRVPLMKIASFDLVNLKLFRYVLKKKIPMIVSRGMASEDELSTVVRLMEADDVSFGLLHCVSSYPTKPEDANLRVIETLRATYRCPAGYSDHTLGIRVPVLSVAAGACVIEKHFTLDTKMQGPDHAISCDPQTLREMVTQVREVEKIMGDSRMRLYEAERPIVQYRRPSR